MRKQVSAENGAVVLDLARWETRAVGQRAPDRFRHGAARRCPTPNRGLEFRQGLGRDSRGRPSSARPSPHIAGFAAICPIRCPGRLPSRSRRLRLRLAAHNCWDLIGKKSKGSLRLYVYVPTLNLPSMRIESRPNHPP